MPGATLGLESLEIAYRCYLTWRKPEGVYMS